MLCALVPSSPQMIDQPVISSPLGATVGRLSMYGMFALTVESPETKIGAGDATIGTTAKLLTVVPFTVATTSP